VVSVEEIGTVGGMGGGVLEGKEKKGREKIRKKEEKNWGRERDVEQEGAKPL
jgi:hypothetical protein